MTARCEAILEVIEADIGTVYLVILVCWHPSGMREYVLFTTGGVARSSLDHRLTSVKPPAWADVQLQCLVCAKRCLIELTNQPLIRLMLVSIGITNILTPEGLKPLAGG
jgi:hypothetical protein